MANEAPLSQNNYWEKIKSGLKRRWEAGKLKFKAFQAKHPRLALLVKTGAWLGVLGMVFAFLFVLLVYKGAFGPLPTYPELRAIQNNTASEVYSDDGVLLGKFYIENRINADFEEISPNIINALVATEDARFFEHGGVDMRAALRVFVKTVLLFNSSSGGGSTLSQQLAKNLYPRRKYWLLSIPVNKVREMFVARRLEKIYVKEELLKLYLNTVPFSENIYGIKVACQRFFNKSPEELSVEEAAVLVGMLKATTAYNPLRNPERALMRRNTVLNQMEKYGYLPEAVCDSLKALPIELKYYKEGNNNGLATYFREHLRQETEEILADFTKPDGSPYNLYTDGLKVFTTINAWMQQYAEEALSSHMLKLQKEFYKGWRKGLPWGSNKALRNAKKRTQRYKSLKAAGLTDEAIDEIFNTPVKMKVFSWEKGEVEKELSPLDSLKYYMTILNAGFLVMEPQTGLIRAWVGGIDHKYFPYDHVKSRRQVGSTFKPLVYAQALRSGMLPCEYTYNRLVTYTEYEDWQPRNSNGEYGGVYSMEGALSQSVNAVTVGIMMRAGVDSVRQLAKDMGIRSRIPAVPAIALGAVEASLYDMVRVYGTFANRGLRPGMHYLDRIETSDGEVIVRFQRPDPQEFERALSQDNADVMIRMLETVVDSGTARRLRYEFGLYGAIAGKTGTTQNQSDGWFIGFTPNLVAGVWVGAESPKVHFRTMSVGQGSNSALPIWGKFMKNIYRDPAFRKWRKATFTPPADTMLALMQCPPYLEEMPILADFWDDYFENPGFLDQLYRNWELEGKEHYINIRPRKSESLSEYTERVQKYYERMKRKKERRNKRKEFWGKILFGKKEEG